MKFHKPAFLPRFFAKKIVKTVYLPQDIVRIDDFHAFLRRQIIVLATKIEIVQIEDATNSMFNVPNSFRFLVDQYPCGRSVIVEVVA